MMLNTLKPILPILLVLAVSSDVFGAVGDGRDDVPISLSSIEGVRDTVEFNIGSPLFLRMHLKETSACRFENGRPFVFDAAGVQLGWGFKEVTDSLLYPDAEEHCERYLYLSSRNSNRLAEGYYTMTVQIFEDERSSLRSDTIVLRPVHAPAATRESYSRFLQEQILEHSPLLRDAATIEGLFAPHLPHSAESAVYHALVLYKVGDDVGAAQELQKAEERGLLQPSASIAARRVAEFLAEQLQENGTANRE